MESDQTEKFEEVKTQKLFAKLPSNYLELTPEEQAKWRSKLGQQLLEQATRLNFHP
jgi:hypothetical protein